MKKLFFFIFPLAFIVGFMPFFFNSPEESKTVSTKNNYVDDVSFSKLNTCWKENEPIIIEKQEPVPAELLKVFPFGYIDNATFVLPEGIAFL